MRHQVGENKANANTETLTQGDQVQSRLAGFWRRASALMIDQAIVSLIIYAYIIIVAFVMGVFLAIFAGLGEKAGLDTGSIITFFETLFSGDSTLMVLLLRILLLVLFFVLIILIPLTFVHGYFIEGEYRYGQTFGKKILGLSVVTEDGSKLTRRQCIIREFFRYIDLFLLIPGTTSFLLSDKNQRLGDRFAQTLVVYSKSDEDKDQYLYMQQEDYVKFTDLLQPHIPTDQGLCQQVSKAAYTQQISQETINPADLESLAGALKLSYNAQVEVDPQSLVIFFAEFLRQSSMTDSL